MKHGGWEADHPESGMAARPRMEAVNKEEDVLRPGETKNCPFCAKTIKIEAVKCTHCGSMITKC
jgi:hypothetical protein